MLALLLEARLASFLTDEVNGRPSILPVLPLILKPRAKYWLFNSSAPDHLTLPPSSLSTEANA
jgi:hypothetical protein